jgi:hypothetical protein
MQDHFLRLKSNLELDPTLAALVATRHAAARTYLENNHPTFKDSKLIGSFQRRTKIHPGTEHKLDIDILVVVGEFHNWATIGGVSPQQALDEMHTTLNVSDRYSRMNPQQDAPTISMTYGDDIQVEFVPAYIDNIGHDQFGNELGSLGRGYWVPKSGSWELADYDHEAKYISEQNQVSKGYLIPVIKMLKAARRVYFSELGSFPLEILAAGIIPISILIREVREIPLTYHDLLLDFFDQAPGQLALPIGIPGTKSKSIFLTPTQVMTITAQFNVIASHMRSTLAASTQADRVSGMRTLYGNHFPVTI